MKTKHAQAFRFVRFVLSAFCLMMMLVPLPSYGADSGSVKGKITDKSDGEGVFGASVSIAGTTIGTATDMNGNFTLQNVPAKQQKLSISIVGYAPASQLVTVTSGGTAVANFQIGQTTVMASEVVVGASLYKQDRLDVPVTVNVVSQEKIRQQANPTLDKVVEDVPGVVVTRAGGTTASTLQIRGSNTYQGGGIGTRVQAYYDGFPINSPESGEIVWQGVNMNAADKVEILKGAAATLYGSGAMGGVVNVFGHIPDKMEVKAGVSVGYYDAPPSTDLSLYRKPAGTTANSIGTPWLWNTYFGLGNKDGKWNYSLLYTHSNDDGYRQNTQNYMNDVKLKLRYDLDAKQYLQLSTFYTETDGGYGYQWGDATKAYDVATPNNLDDSIRRKNALIGLNYVNLLSDKLSLDTRLYYTYNDSYVDYNKSNVTQFGMVTRLPGDFNETLAKRYGAGIKLDWKATDHHRLLFGVDGNIIDYQSTQVTAALAQKNTLKPIQEKNAALFVQDEWKLTEKLTSLLSLRYDWSGINADQVTYNKYYFTTPPPTRGDNEVTENIAHKSVDAFSPRVALNYKADEEMAFRASWGKSFRAPTMYERFIRDAGFAPGNPNPALNKETMTAYEVGMFKKFGDKVSLDVSGFINFYDNLIESKYYGQFPNWIYFQYGNISKARIWGIETSLNYRPSNEWAFNAAYTYMNARNLSYVPNADALAAILNDKNPDPSWLQYRPEHTASANVTWKPATKLSLNFNGRYVGKYKNIAQMTNPLGSNYPGNFVVFDTGFKFHPSQEVSLSVLCKNIGNLQYEEAEWFRAPGRSFVAGADFTF